jgi:hypothetical protein
LTVAGGGAAVGYSTFRSAVGAGAVGLGRGSVVSVGNTSGGNGVENVSTEMVGNGVGSAGWNGVGVGDGFGADVTSVNGVRSTVGGSDGAQAVSRKSRARVMRRSMRGKDETVAQIANLRQSIKSPQGFVYEHG